MADQHASEFPRPDIVPLLRNAVEGWANEAADEIDRLRAAVVELYGFMQVEFESEPHEHPIESYIIAPEARDAACRAWAISEDAILAITCTSTEEADRG